MPEYFTLEEARDLPDLNNTAKYTDAAIERAAAYIVGVIERVVGTSFVPRTFTRTLSGTGSDITLPSPFVLEVTSVAVAGGTAGPYSLDGSTLAGSWPRGIRNITVTYDAGYSEDPPADIKDAALQGTRARLLDTVGDARVNDRTQSISNDAGGTTSFVLAGVDRPTGYPEVDSVILGWRRRLFGFGMV